LFTLTVFMCRVSFCCSISVMTVDYTHGIHLYKISVNTVSVINCHHWYTTTKTYPTQVNTVSVINCNHWYTTTKAYPTQVNTVSVINCHQWYTTTKAYLIHSDFLHNQCIHMAFREWTSSNYCYWHVRLQLHFSNFSLHIIHIYYKVSFCPHANNGIRKKNFH
jgi:hypothetical protein